MTRYFVEFGEETFQIDVSDGTVCVDGEMVDAELMPVPGTDVWSLIIDGCSHRVVATSSGSEAGSGSGSGRWDLRFGGESYSVRVLDARRRHIEDMTDAGQASKGPAPIKASMPGLVIRIEVAEGDIVRPGQGLLIIEAMKMENELKADTEARIVQIHVSEGQAVEKDQLLIDLEPLPGGAEA